MLPAFVHRVVPIDVFSNGLMLEFLKIFGIKDYWPTMKPRVLIGHGYRWMERPQKHHYPAQKKGANPTDRGKQGVKRSILTEGAGIPIAVVIDGANRHDIKLFQET